MGKKKSKKKKKLDKEKRGGKGINKYEKFSKIDKQ